MNEEKKDVFYEVEDREIPQPPPKTDDYIEKRGVEELETNSEIQATEED